MEPGLVEREAWRRDMSRMPIFSFADLVIVPFSKTDVVMSWCNNPNDFFVQLSENRESFTQMMDCLQEDCENMGGLEVDAKVGLPVMAKFPEDDCWYRAEVTKVKDWQVEVDYVDYGNRLLRDQIDLKPVDSEYLNYPRQAIHCSLKDVKPITSTWNLSDFLPAKKKYFMHKSFQCIFWGKKNGLYQVDLLLNKKSISEILENEGFASIVKQKVREITDFPPVDYSRWLNQSVEVFVSHVKDMTHFFCRLDRTAMDYIVQKIASYEKTHDGETNSKQIINQNTCLIHDELNYLYKRAKIIDMESETTVRVMYVDYGNEEVVSIDKLTAMPSYLQKIPQQAVLCGLKNGQIGNQLDVIFKKEVKDKYFKAYVHSLEGRKMIITLLDGGNIPVITKVQHLLTQFLESWNPIMDSHQISTKLAESSSAKKGDTTDSIIPSFKVPETTSFLAYMSHINNPHAIWVQLSSNEDIANEFADSLYKTYTKMAPVPKEKFDVTSGRHYVCYRESDDNWYRSQVIETCDDGMVKVFFCDYGDSDIVRLENLRPLLPEFAKIPYFSLKVKMAIEPISDTKIWRSEATDMIRALTGNGTLDVIVHLIDVENEHLAEIFVGELNMAEEIVEKGLAKNVELTSVGTPVIVSPAAIPNIRSFMAYICHVRNPNSLWIQKASCNEKFLELGKRMSVYYNNAAKHLIKRADVGSFWATKDISDIWFRVVVLATEGSLVEVCFCDTGHMASTSVKLLQPLAPHFAVEPCLSLEVSLNVQPVYDNGSWSKDATNFINSVTQFGQLPGKIEFLERSSHSGLLVNISVGELDLTASLIHLAMAKFVSFKKFPEVGSEAQVVISVVEDPSNFWVQLVEESAKEQLQYIETSVNKCLKMLFPFKAMPKKGQHCLAIWPEDSQLYRSVVTDVSGDDIEVIMFDYGSKVVVNFKSLFLMPENLSKLPPMAFACQLKEKPVKMWSSKAENMFRILSGADDDEQEPKVARVIAHRKTNVIELIAQGKIVSEVMKREGFAITEGEILEENMINETESARNIVTIIETGKTSLEIPNDGKVEVNRIRESTRKITDDRNQTPSKVGVTEVILKQDVMDLMENQKCFVKEGNETKFYNTTVVPTLEVQSKKSDSEKNVEIISESYLEKPDAEMKPHLITTASQTDDDSFEEENGPQNSDSSDIYNTADEEFIPSNSTESLQLEEDLKNCDDIISNGADTGNGGFKSIEKNRR